MASSIASDAWLPACFRAVEVEDLFEFPHQSGADEPSGLPLLDHSGASEDVYYAVERPGADVPPLPPLFPRLDRPAFVLHVAYGPPEFLSRRDMASGLPEEPFEQPVEVGADGAASQPEKGFAARFRKSGTGQPPIPLRPLRPAGRTWRCLGSRSYTWGGLSSAKPCLESATLAIKRSPYPRLGRIQ